MKRMFRIPFRGQIRLASMAFHHAWCPLRRPGPGPLGTQVAAPTGQAQNGCPPRAAWHRNPRVTPLGPRGSRPFGCDSLPVPACGGAFWGLLARAGTCQPDVAVLEDPGLCSLRSRTLRLILTSMGPSGRALTNLHLQNALISGFTHCFHGPGGVCAALFTKI